MYRYPLALQLDLDDWVLPPGSLDDHAGVALDGVRELDAVHQDAAVPEDLDVFDGDHRTITHPAGSASRVGRRGHVLASSRRFAATNAPNEMSDA
jgi:hypothetical protein